jgi:hypothetical protein
VNLFKSSSPPSRVPTLTEVVELVPVDAGEAMSVDPAAVDGKLKAPVPGALAPLPAVNAPEPESPLSAPAELPGQDELVRQIMADIQRQIDAMLEVRMKETLAPAITRFTDALARDTRAELGGVLKDVVTRAVAQALTKQRFK